MIQDDRWKLSAGQAVTTASAFSTNGVDVSDVLQDVCNGHDLQMVVHVDTSFVGSSGTPSLRFNIMLDASNSAPGTLFTCIGATGQVLVSNGLGANELAAGQLIVVKVNPITDAQMAYMKAVKALGFPLRYVYAYYELIAGEFSAGTLSTQFAFETPTRVGIHQLVDTAPGR